MPAKAWLDSPHQRCRTVVCACTVYGRGYVDAVKTTPEESMADVEQFKDDLQNSADGLIGGSRGDFMEALGEAVYSRAASDQQDSIIAAYLALQEVLDANVNNLEDEADEAIEEAEVKFNETVGDILGV